MIGINYQIQNWEAKGYAQESYRYWILGEGLFTNKSRRWSILDGDQTCSGGEWLGH